MGVFVSWGRVGVLPCPSKFWKLLPGPAVWGLGHTPPGLLPHEAAFVLHPKCAEELPSGCPDAYLSILQFPTIRDKTTPDVILGF